MHVSARCVRVSSLSLFFKLSSGRVLIFVIHLKFFFYALKKISVAFSTTTGYATVGLSRQNDIFLNMFCLHV